MSMDFISIEFIFVEFISTITPHTGLFNSSLFVFLSGKYVMVFICKYVNIAQKRNSLEKMIEKYQE
jgi:hypothetical protein